MQALRNIALAAALALGGLAGCSDSGAATPDVDSGVARDGAGDSSTPPSCFKDPKTHIEIINACTDAEKIDKTPTLPLLGKDGKLPPLP